MQVWQSLTQLMLLNDNDAASHKDLLQLGIANVSMMTMTGQAKSLHKEGSKARNPAALP